MTRRGAGMRCATGRACRQLGGSALPSPCTARTRAGGVA
jgi:hypothetical protein